MKMCCLIEAFWIQKNDLFHVATFHRIYILDGHHMMFKSKIF